MYDHLECVESMSQEVNQDSQKLANQVRDALVERIGAERIELWIPACTNWALSGSTLTLSFEEDSRCQFAQKMLSRDLGSALSAYLGEPAEVLMRVSQESANAPQPAAATKAKHSAQVRVHLGDELDSPSPQSRRSEKLAAASRQMAAKNDPQEPILWDEFVSGDSNQVAWAAAKMILSEPGNITPILLHGSSGVGKSMLVSALAERLRTLHRLRRVVHLTSEQFLNDFTDGLRGGGLPMFRRKYRDVEVLILEDLQFFAGKKSSIAEVKHTLDNLLRLKKQVIFTSNCSLNELEGLGNELVTRLRGGLTAPLFPLDREIRHQILTRKIESLGLEVPADVIEEIADRVTGDGRVLSGIVHRLTATCAFSDGPLNQQSCWAAIGDLVQATKPIVRIVDIEKVVCDVFGLEPDSLQSTSKIRRVSQPRMLAMFLARKYTPSAYKEIGQYFGKRRHSTVISAEKTVETWLEENSEIEVGRGLSARQAVRHVESQLQVG